MTNQEFQTAVMQRLDGIDGRLDAMDGRLDSIEGKVDDILKLVRHLSAERDNMEMVQRAARQA